MTSSARAIMQPAACVQQPATLARGERSAQRPPNIQQRCTSQTRKPADPRRPSTLSRRLCVSRERQSPARRRRWSNTAA
eukprot:1818019-Alexandrium_andersonii.AAC.1